MAPLPTSYAQEAALQAIQDRISALSGVYNPRHLSLYAEGLRGLTDQGYYDPGTLYAEQMGGLSPEGAATYGLTGQGGHGQAYRSALTDAASAFASRGAYFGSARVDQQRAQVEGLNNAREAIMRRLASEQTGLTGEQTQQRAGLSGDLATAQGSYADWRATQQAALPPEAAPTVAMAPPRRPAPLQWRGADQPNRQTLSRRFGVPVNRIRVTRPGGGGYLARPR